MISVVWRVVRLPILAVGLLVLILGGISTIMWLSDHLTARFQSRFAFLAPRMSDFQETARGNRHRESSEAEPGKLRNAIFSPKIVAVTVYSGQGDSGWIKRGLYEFDPIMLSMPKEWLPQAVEDVNLVIACRWSTDLVGTYANGAKAYVDRGRFYAYDFKSGLVLFEGTAQGDDPPSSVSSQTVHRETQIYGSRADANVVEQIRRGLEAMRTQFAAGTDMELTK